MRGTITKVAESSGKSDERSVFETAIWFSNAAKVVHDKSLQRGFEPLGIPFVVLSAFTFELLLKALIRIEGRQPKKGRDGHDFVTLFGQISVESQLAIREASKTRIQEIGQIMAQVQTQLKDFGPLPEKVDFDYVLQRSADAFHNFRYHFEGLGEAGDGWWAGPIATATHARIIELRPNWST